MKKTKKVKKKDRIQSVFVAQQMEILRLMRKNKELEQRLIVAYKIIEKL